MKGSGLFVHIGIVTLGAVLVAGCDGGGDADPIEEPGAGAADVAADVEAAAAAGDREGVARAVSRAVDQANEDLAAEDLANPRQLEPFIPETVVGLQRSMVNVDEAEESGRALTTSADASYWTPGDPTGPTISISITDAGSMAGMMRGLVPDRDVDRSDGTMTNRTVEVNGRRAMLTYDTADRSGEVQVPLVERLMVTVDGRNIGQDRIVEAAGAIDYAGIIAKAESGALRERTAEQQITLARPEELQALLPTSANGEPAQGQRSWEVEPDYSPTPHSVAHANYGGEPYIRLFQFKTPEHAREMFPADPEQMLSQFPGSGDAEQGEAQWAGGHETVYVVIPDRLGLSRTYVGRSVIEVRGPGDVEALRQMVEQVDVPALQDLAK